MRFKIIPKSGCAILFSLLFIGLCLAGVDGCNNMESSMYQEVRNAQDYDRWYECMKYLDKYPTGEHSAEISDIMYQELEKDGRIGYVYGFGEKYSNIPLGNRLKNLSYILAVRRNDYNGWEEYIEKADASNLRDAKEKLDSIKQSYN